MSVASFPRIREDFVFANSIVLQGRNISEGRNWNVQYCGLAVYGRIPYLILSEVLRVLSCKKPRYLVSDGRTNLSPFALHPLSVFQRLRCFCIDVI